MHVIAAHLNAPGRVRLLANGVQVGDGQAWDYAVTGTNTAMVEDWAQLYGLHLDPDRPATLTVIPERVTGDRVVTIREPVSR